MHLANLQGGPDNTTVIVARVGGEPRDDMVDSKSDVVLPSADIGPPFVPRFALMMYYPRQGPLGVRHVGLGILLAGVAIVLAALGWAKSIYAFIFSGLALLGGIVALMIQHIRETVQGKPGAGGRVIHVYRQTPCPVDAAIYERLVQWRTRWKATSRKRCGNTTRRRIKNI